MNILGKTVTLAAIGLCAACARTERTSGVTSSTAATRPQGTAAPAASVAGQIVVVRSGAQATIGEMRIGAGNIWAGSDQALTAQLWIRARDPSASQHPRVRAGQVVEVSGATISVVSVESDSVKLALR
jgi:hypothetical protein